MKEANDAEIKRAENFEKKFEKEKKLKEEIEKFKKDL